MASLSPLFQAPLLAGPPLHMMVVSVSVARDRETTKEALKVGMASPAPRSERTSNSARGRCADVRSLVPRRA
ncbi:hypothetical protein FB451DRAFT_1411311 [Mycena latifolia]|nr:hypothetical protein FB451DRAFT_1411311 [Mycena latifolia]